MNRSDLSGWLAGEIAQDHRLAIGLSELKHRRRHRFGLTIGESPITLMLTRVSIFLNLLLCVAMAASAQEIRVNVVLVGDSTVTDTAGWGKAFAARLAPGVQCTNKARGGASAKARPAH